LDEKSSIFKMLFKIAFGNSLSKGYRVTISYAL
jgi:hypothetical protein